MGHIASVAGKDYSKDHTQQGEHPVSRHLACTLFSTVNVSVTIAILVASAYVHE